jgi:hypothetical protein
VRPADTCRRIVMARSAPVERSKRALATRAWADCGARIGLMNIRDAAEITISGVLHEEPQPRVLVVGLDPYRLPGPWDPKPISDAIEFGLARFAQYGVGVE